MIRVAGVQTDVAFARKDSNLARIESAIRESAAHGAALTVFPECMLTGYCFTSKQEAMPYAETIPGSSTLRIAKSCRATNTHAIVGLLEADGAQLYNACALIGPAGLIGSYRKVHLPHLGVDQFTTPGDQPFRVHATDAIRVGMAICYDAAFPESARVMALDGADLIALPTNWPPGAECTADFVINTRAMENHVYFMAVNRVGSERGFEFIGHSKICAPAGRTIAEALHTDETILYADVDVALARNKHIVRVPGRHEINRFADRRPQHYARIAQSQ